MALVISIVGDVLYADTWPDQERANDAAEFAAKHFKANPGVLAFKPEPYGTQFVMELRTVAGDIRIGWVAK